MNTSSATNGSIVARVNVSVSEDQEAEAIDHLTALHQLMSGIVGVTVAPMREPGASDTFARSAFDTYTGTEIEGLLHATYKVIITARKNRITARDAQLKQDILDIAQGAIAKGKKARSNYFAEQDADVRDLMVCPDKVSLALADVARAFPKGTDMSQVAKRCVEMGFTLPKGKDNNLRIAFDLT